MITGGCYCGGLRYEAGANIEASVQCHCRECQYITGGHPNVIIAVPLADFSYVRGEASVFARSDLEHPVNREFCRDCGTAIGSRSPSRPNSMLIKVGTLDDPSIFTAERAIFVKDSQPFHVVPGGVPICKLRHE
jgi:Uncharacterized conserved protein